LETSNELSYEKGGTCEFFWMVLVGLDLKFVDLEIPSHVNGTMVCQSWDIFYEAPTEIV
jgi:hypothetical protein